MGIIILLVIILITIVIAFVKINKLINEKYSIIVNYYKSTNNSILELKNYISDNNAYITKLINKNVEINDNIKSVKSTNDKLHNKFTIIENLIKNNNNDILNIINKPKPTRTRKPKETIAK